VATLHHDLRRAMVYLWGAGGAVFAVLTLYILHANIRNRAWPSLDTLCDEVGCVRDTALAARRWLIEHGALYPVPYAQRVAEERAAPRAEVLQISGILRVNEAVFQILYVPGQSSIESTINSLLSTPLSSSTTTTDEKPNVFKVWEQNIGLLTPIIAESLIDLEATYGEEFVTLAIGQAVKANARNLNYIVKVCQNASARGELPGAAHHGGDPGPAPRPSYLKDVTADDFTD